MRRNRGRRGLDVLGALQNDAAIPTQITDMDVSDVRDVDSKLVALAQEISAPIRITSYNVCYTKLLRESS